MMNNIKFETVEVSPSLAHEWLKRNRVNRKLSPSVVERYARDMRNGDWLLNGDTIRFDYNGELKDGQHRLNAVILAGVNVQMIVVRGIEQSCTIDSGYKRTDAANFQIIYDDHNFDICVQADLNLIASAYANLDKITVYEHKKLYDFLYDEIIFIKSVPKNKKIGAIVRAACIIAIKKYNISKEKTARFIDIVNTGYALNESENQAIAYRNEFLKKKYKWSSGNSRVQALKQTIGSIMGFSKGLVGKRIVKANDADYPEIKALLSDK